MAIKKILFQTGKYISYIFPFSFYNTFYQIRKKIYSGWISRNFEHFGNSNIKPPMRYFRGGKYISVGNDTTIGKNVILTAWDKYGTDFFSPQIIIGDSCSIGDEANITAINSIYIGNNVLTGREILITDNSHGESEKMLSNIPPAKRSLYSKGPVIIDDNVWIGDKASILPGVHIGAGCIIAANAVVTKDIPPYCVVAGVPAKIIKRL